MFNDLVVAYEADLLLGAGSETNLTAKIASYTPAITKAEVLTQVKKATALLTISLTGDAGYTEVFADIRSLANAAAKTAKIEEIAQRVIVVWFNTNVWKATAKSSGYRIQNYTYTASVATTTGFPNTWDAATILPTYLMDPANSSETGAKMVYNRSNIVIAMNEYVPNCHYASLNPAKFNAMTTNMAFANRALMIANASYNTPAKACGMYAKLQAETYGWLEALYMNDTAATITAAASMDSLFCSTWTNSVETYAKMVTQKFYSSADFMQAINVSQHFKQKGTSTVATTKIAKADLSNGVAHMTTERTRVFLLSH